MSFTFDQGSKMENCAKVISEEEKTVETEKIDEVPRGEDTGEKGSREKKRE